MKIECCVHPEFKYFLAYHAINMFIFVKRKISKRKLQWTNAEDVNWINKIRKQ